MHSEQWVDEMTDGIQLPRELMTSIRRMIAPIEGEHIRAPERAKARVRARIALSDYRHAYSELRDALVVSQDDVSPEATRRLQAANRHMADFGGALIFVLGELCRADPSLPQAVPEQVYDALKLANKRSLRIYLSALRLQNIPDALAYDIRDACEVAYKRGDEDTGLLPARNRLADAFSEFAAAARKSQLCERPAALQPIHERNLRQARGKLCDALSKLALADPFYETLRDNCLSALQRQRSL